MDEKIYKLETLAVVEKTTVGYLGQVIARAKGVEPIYWRQYKLIRAADRAWVAVPKDSDIEIL